MILARSGGSEYTLGIVSGVLGIGGILGGLLVSLIKLPQNTVKVLYLSAGISFVAGDLLMGLGQNLTLWCIAGLAASIPIPFVSAAQNVILLSSCSRENAGKNFFRA